MLIEGHRCAPGGTICSTSVGLVWATADFLVTVSWTNATGDVMGRGYSVLKKVAPGQTVTFEIKAKVAAGATQCVKGVEYGTISG